MKKIKYLNTILYAILIIVTPGIIVAMETANTGSAGNHNHTVSGNSGSTGSGNSHNNLQPYITLNYIIKY